jgi:hypothetical protein
MLGLLAGVSAASITAHLGGGPVDPDASTTWRIYMTTPEVVSGGRTIGLAEITLYDIAGSPVSVAGATLSASSEWGTSESVDKAFDGDPSTRWAGPTDITSNVAWVQIVFPSPQNLGGFALRARNDGLNYQSAPVDPILQKSDGVGGWTNILQVQNQTSWESSQLRIYKLGAVWWRLNITDTDNNSSVGVQEVEFRSVVDTPEAMTGGFAVANGQWTTSENAAKAFDGDTGTNWGKNGLPGLLYYGFDTAKTVAQVYIMARSSTSSLAAPETFTLEKSEDFGGSWTTVMTVTGEAAWTSLEERTFNVP